MSMAKETSRNIGSIVLLGAPGAGKGTQAKLIAARCRIPHISTGDLLRENVRRGSELGREAQAFMSRGELVPDMLVCNMVAHRLEQPDCERGYVLDGFPRTAAQAGWLDALLQDRLFDNPERLKGTPIVIAIEVPYNELLRRLTGRRTCPSCGRIYNVYLQPPRRDELCDVDGSRLVIRNDDREEVITERLKAYELQTKPVADYYASRGRLHVVDGNRAVREVTADVWAAIENAVAVSEGAKARGTHGDFF